MAHSVGNLQRIPGTWLPEDLSLRILEMTPDSVPVLRLTSRELKRVAEVFLRLNREEIMHRCPSLSPSLCIHIQADDTYFDSDQDPFGIQFHLSIPKAIRSLGVPVTECPDQILPVGEVERFSVWVQQIQDLNLERMWQGVLPQLMESDPTLEQVPQEQAPAQEIRGWMEENDFLLSGMEKLILDDCRLTCVPKEIGLFTGLENLSFNNNQIGVLSRGLFYGLHQMKNLVFRKNFLTALPSDLFYGMEQLQGVSFRKNQIRALPPCLFDGLDQLEIVILGKNQLRSLPGELFSGLGRLKRLNLEQNLFSALPPGLLQGLVSLKELDLGNNQFSGFPVGLFQGLVSLKGLDLGNNQFSGFPVGLFHGLNSMSGLDLSHNRFSRFPAAMLDGLVNLEGLSLHGNPFDGFPAELVGALKELGKLRLTEDQSQTLVRSSIGPALWGRWRTYGYGVKMPVTLPGSGS